MGLPSLERLTLCRGLLDRPALWALQECLKAPSERAASLLAASLLEEAENSCLRGNLLSSFIVHFLWEGDNPAAEAVQRSGSWGRGLERALCGDMEVLLPYLKILPSAVSGLSWLDDYDPSAESPCRGEADLKQALCSCSDPKQAALILLEHYQKNGSGLLARFEAFRLARDGALTGADVQPLEWDELIGCDRQKEQLILNMEAFMAGLPANNVLLTGARGTGKSSAVRALLHQFSARGLRLVQVTRDQLELLAGVIDELSRVRSHRFVLFFDDLSFDENEKDYKFLKSVLEGSVTSAPDTVMVMATSNRRHLLKENWEDRSDEMDDMYRRDNTNESLSLSDRFGLILHYGEPSQAEYLRMIDQGLRRHGIVLAEEELRIQGLRWEMEHSGRNGRTAAQFVKWYAGTGKAL